MKSLKNLLKPYHISWSESQVLEGYSSTNYLIKNKQKNYLLKYYTNADEYQQIYQEDAILYILSQKDLPFQIPNSIRQMETYRDGSFSRLLPYIEGKLLSSVTHTDTLLFNYGRAVGLLNQSCLNLKNDTIQARELFWDMKHTLLNVEKISFIEQAQDRKIVDYYFDLFEHTILPIQKSLRRLIIHSDLNDNNVIVENEEIKGIIDFGDITYSPLIYEVAIALTYIMLANEDDPFEKAKAFVQGYHSILPLKEEEIELLPILIPSRLCVSVCNSAKKKNEGEGSEYVLISEKPAWKLLHKWVSINPKWIKDFFLEAVNLPIETFDMEKLKERRQMFTGKSLGTSYQEPIYMTGGAFQYMYDSTGKTYLDAYNNISHVGHCHPNISKIISAQVRKLNTNTRYLYPELVDYASKLSQTFPEELHKLFCVNSGSAASDLAIRMARDHTNRDTIAIVESGYHGNTITGIEISDYKHNGKGGQGKPETVITLPLPNVYNGKFKTGKAYAHHAIQQMETEIKNGNTPCALIVEPVSGCGGQVPLAEGYLACLEPFLKKHDILLIVDEVQTGFGRLGKYFWGFEMHKIVPDIVIIGKPMGNGHPISAVITAGEIADGFANGMEFFTSFGGNPVSCAVASEVLKTINEEKLQENAKNIGAFLKNELEIIKNQFACIGDVRGEGLFLGIEFINYKGETGAEIATYVKECLKQQLILVGTDGPFENVIKIKPPMCFDFENANYFIRKIGNILEQMTISGMR